MKEIAPEWASTVDMAKILGQSPSWLEKRIGHEFKEGIHTHLVSRRCRRWGIEITRDRFYNWDDDAAHNKAISHYMDTFLSNKCA